MFLVTIPPLIIFRKAKILENCSPLIFSGKLSMSGLDNLIAFIDNGGTRSGSERRRLSESEYMPERRTRYDRRRALNKKRKRGKERRTIFVD